MAVNDKQVLTSINQVSIWFNFRLLSKIENIYHDLSKVC